MTKIVKVLDKGGDDDKHDKDGEVVGKVTKESKVLQRHAVDAKEMVAIDPDRYEILDEDDDTPHDEDILGNAVQARKGKRAPKAKPAKPAAPPKTTKQE